MPANFPVMLNVQTKLCVVVGGGLVALRKVRTLVGRGAKVRVISPEVVDEILEFADSGAVDLRRRGYQEGDLVDAFLCVAATNDGGLNRMVRDDARARDVFVNVVDDPEGSDYLVPSFFEDGPLLISVSTKGMSPAVSRTLRRMIQGYLGGEFGAALAVINDFRENVVKREISDPRARVVFWERAMSEELLDHVREGRVDRLKTMLAAALSNFNQSR